MLTYHVSPRRQLARRNAHLGGTTRPDVHIPVDVYLEDDTYVISAFVPGIDSKGVKIEVLENIVSIRGEFPLDASDGVEYLLRERPSGDFSRKLRLPTVLNASQADAEVVNGVLTVRVPKAEEAKPKQIKVKVK